MKKLLIIVLVAAVVIAAGYVGFIKYENYKQNKFVESITPHVKNASLRLANDVRYETEQGTKITYKELFEKLEFDIAEIDKRILDVQTIATPSNREVTDPVIVYLKGSQELLRSLLSKYRKRLAVSSAKDFAERSVDNIRSSHSLYGLEYTKKAADSAIKDWEKTANEYSEAVSDVFNAANNMKTARAKVASTIPIHALADPAILEAVAKINKIDKTESTSKEDKK